MRKVFYRLYLQQFAEGGTEGASGDTTSSQDAAETTGEESGQDAADGQQETQRATFEELIKGDYKEDYDKAVQKIINRRFSKAKANEDKLNQMAPIMDALASKYGVQPDDIASIAKYVGEDDQMYEDAAYKAGMTVEQFKNYSRVMAENERLRAEHEANEQRRAANAQLAQWREEEKALQQEFPDFSLDAMIENEAFYRMVGSGVPIRNAYIAMNADGILKNAMGYTAQQVAKKTADTIRQRGNRPVEGGMSGQAASKVGSDISKLTNAEIAEMHERILRGELIHP